MLADRVTVAVPNPGGPIGVGSTITLGAALTGQRSFLTGIGAGNPAYFVLTDGSTRTITGVWTVNAGSPETATITEILWNDRTGDTSAETFASACTAFCAQPARETLLYRGQPRVVDRRILGGVVGTVDFALSGAFSAYRLIGVGLFSGTSGMQLSMRISRDNLSTIDAGASDYASDYRFQSNVMVEDNIAAGTTILMSEVLVANAQVMFDAVIQPGTVALGFQMQGSSSFLNAAGTRITQGRFVGQRLTAGRATHARLIGANMAAGAVFTLEGLA